MAVLLELLLLLLLLPLLLLLLLLLLQRTNNSISQHQNTHTADWSMAQRFSMKYKLHKVLCNSVSDLEPMRSW